MKKHLTALPLRISLFALCTLLPAALNGVDKKPHFNDADIVLLDDREYTTVRQDGTALTTDTCRYQILTEAGRRQLRRQSFGYSTNYDKVTVTAVNIFKTDGRTIKLDVPKYCQTAIDHEQMGSRIFDPSHRILTLSIPDLAVNDIVEISVTRELFKPRIPGEWSDISVLQANFPISNYVYTVDVPADKPLRAIAVKDEVKGTLKFTQSRKGDRIIYTWRAVNVPKIVPEPGMPSMYTCVQRVLTSTVASWEDISRWYDKLCAPALAATTPEMAATVAELTKNKKSKTAKIHAIFQFVSQKIRYTGVTDEETAPGYEPHKVDRTFARKHGVCRDKAALLVAMLRLAGIEAYPVLFMSGTPKDKEVPNIYFNHAIVGAVDEHGKQLLMDPTFETTTELFPAYLGNCSYLAAKPQGDTLRRSPVIPAKNNLMSFANYARLLPDGSLQGAVLIHCRGVHDQMYRDALSRWQPEQAREYFAVKLRETIPGAMLTKFSFTPKNILDMSKELRIKLEYSAENIFTSGNTPQLLTLPELFYTLGTVNNLFRAMQLTERRFPLEALPRMVAEESVILLPDNLKIEALPAKLSFDIPGTAAMERTVTRQSNRLVAKNLFAIHTAEISPADYRKIKAALLDFDAASKILPVVKMQLPADIPAKGNPALALHRKSDSLLHCDIRKFSLNADGKSWTETRHVKRKIFTYAGAVRYSTIAIPYVENFDSVEISGIITTPEGKSHTIAPAEINRMDEPWVAGSRYSGGKIATVALPGVTPGSFIEYTFTRRTTRRPFFHAALAAQCSEPALKRQLIVDVPEKIANFTASSGNDKITLTEKRSNGRRLLTYTVLNSAKLPGEIGAPPAEFLPDTIHVSTGNAEVFAAELSAALQAKLEPVSPEISALTAKLTGDKKDNMAKIQAIRDFVTKNIRSAGPDLNKVPWQYFSTPLETLKQGSGNPADTALLYGAMLQSCGISFNFLAVSKQPFIRNAVIPLARSNNFSTLILHLPQENIYLNDGGFFAHIGSAANENLLALKLEKTLPPTVTTVAPVNRTMREVVCNLGITPNGDATAEFTFYYRGRLFEREHQRISILTEAKLQQHFEAVASKISQSAKILYYNCGVQGDAYKITLALALPKYAGINGKYMNFVLPLANKINPLNVPGLTRKQPYLQHITANKKYSWRITLPDGYKAQTGSGSTFTYGDGAITFSDTRKQEKNIFSREISLRLEPVLLPAAAYGEVLEFDRMLKTPDNCKLLLKK